MDEAKRRRLASEVPFPNEDEGDRPIGTLKELLDLIAIQHGVMDNLTVQHAVLEERTQNHSGDLRGLREQLAVLSDYALTASSGADRIEKLLLAHIVKDTESKTKLLTFAILTLASSLSAALLSLVH